MAISGAIVEGCRVQKAQDYYSEGIRVLCRMMRSLRSLVCKARRLLRVSESWMLEMFQSVSRAKLYSDMDLRILAPGRCR
jgi:hypothetical protein